MLAINIISLVALLAIIVYAVCFFCRYRVIPQSLSVTAEYPGQLRWWQVTICTVMGWLGYYYPTIYTYAEHSLWPMLTVAGVGGLALAGYYSYTAGIESNNTLIIHKTGAAAGVVLISAFYLYLGWYWIIAPFLVALLLGLFIKGKRMGFPDDNTIIFWCEIAIIAVIGSDIVLRFIETVS